MDLIGASMTTETGESLENREAGARDPQTGRSQSRRDLVVPIRGSHTNLNNVQIRAIPARGTFQGSSSWTLRALRVVASSW